MDEDQLRSKVLRQLEDRDWDMSDEGLDKIAHELRGHFGSEEQARDFVDSQASYLYDRIEDYYS